MGRELSLEEKNEIIARNIATPEGRYVLGQTMLEPFRLGRDYVAINRSIFAVDNVPTGAPLWYDKDPQFSACTLGKNGMVPYTVVEGDRVHYDPYLLTQLVRIPVTEVAIRRFDILDRSQKKAAIEIGKLEDKKAFTLIDYASRTATGHNDVPSSTAGLTRAVLADTFAQVEKWNAPVVTILMHPTRFRDIRVWGRNDLEYVTNMLRCIAVMLYRILAVRGTSCFCYINKTGQSRWYEETRIGRDCMPNVLENKTKRQSELCGNTERKAEMTFLARLKKNCYLNEP